MVHRRVPFYASAAAAATSHPLASAEALAVLRAGGSAADACIAACAVQCVVEPHMTGVGGDCFALVKKPNSPPLALNGSGRTPKALSADWCASKKVDSLAENSPLSVTVPGAVDAWKSLHARFGRLPWSGLFAAAIRYAAEGYPVAARVASDWNLNIAKLVQDETTKNIFLPGGKAPREGDIHSQPKLAKTLMSISQDGGRAFYRGAIAQDIISRLNSGGAPHTADDFAEHKSEWMTPIYGDYRRWRIWQCPPNGQGVVALLMLSVMGKDEEWKKLPTALCIHRFAEITRHAYQWRDTKLGDEPVDVQALITTEADNIIAAIGRPLATPLSASGKEHRDTVYLTAIDQWGLAVSFINSLFHPFGSGITAPESGVLLHNRGLSFSLSPNHPNALAGGVRPLHTIIPAIAEGPNGEVLSFGVMGGDYQAAGQAWVLSKFLDEGKDLQAAIDAPRVFNYPDALYVETGVDAETRATLTDMGHVVKEQYPIGGGQAVMRVTAGRLIAASDSRKDGMAIGY